MFTKQSISRAFAAACAIGLIACGGGGDAETPADSAAMGDTPPPAVATSGETEYNNTCSVCHQADGNGMATAFPPLAGSEIVNNASPNRLIAIVLKGLSGPVTVKGAEYNGIMPPQEGMLTDDQIAAIATYERSSWGNTGAAVTAAQVAEVRAAHASRTAAWTIGELEAAIP